MLSRSWHWLKNLLSTPLVTGLVFFFLGVVDCSLLYLLCFTYVDQMKASHSNPLSFFFYFLPFTEALSTSDIPKLQTKVVDAIPPEVFVDMSVSQLQVSTVI